MKYLDLQKIIKTNIFTIADLAKYFSKESESLIKTQIYRFAKKKLVFQIKKGIYCFDLGRVDQFELASILYPQSYISLESALNYYGLIPDIPLSVTSVTPVTTKTIKSVLGIYFYSKISPKLFFGYQTIIKNNLRYYFAKKEKAFLDFIYIRKIRSLEDLRIDTKLLDKKFLRRYIKSYPNWVKQIKYE